MRKMKTLFKRQFENHVIVKCLNEVEPECQWVLNRRMFGNRKNRWDMLFNKEWENL